MPSVSVIVPTFREAENVVELIERIERVRAAALPELDLTIVDDDSDDGTADVVRRAARPWVTLHVRRGERGLSTAVIAGLQRSRGDTLVVMDADLSHPPERIGDLVACLDRGDEFALGSRYVSGGSTNARWSLYRALNSRIATILAHSLTRVHDPMSGFFALRRSTFEQSATLNPLGYKIGLELLVKCRCQRVSEVPIQFAERTRGKSKLTLAQQWLYLRHLARLLRFRWHDRGSRKVGA